MQNRFDLKDINKITKVSRWCQNNLQDADWQLEVLSIFPPHYKFNFNNPHTHLLVALKHS